MLLTDFDFELPEELIAQSPAPNRSGSRLLVVDGQRQAFADLMFPDVAEQLGEGDLLVMNDTKVVPARLFGRKATGGKVEILLERVTGQFDAVVQIKSSKSPKPGTLIYIEDGASASLRVEGREGAFFTIRTESVGIAELFEVHGHVPLPPYIRREDLQEDKERYQTVYARHPGAVAAPTAGLHFDEVLLDRLREKGVETGFVTLHVGAGTFQPVRSDSVEEHNMHSEQFSVSVALADRINAAREAGRRVVAVGTTTVRCLESAFDQDHGLVRPVSGETDIFIYPGRPVHVPDGLLTNFHLPQSTLIMLVAAYVGTDLVLDAYRHAVAQRYRFFSYGDAMLLWR